VPICRQLDGTTLQTVPRRLVVTDKAGHLTNIPSLADGSALGTIKRRRAAERRPPKTLSTQCSAMTWLLSEPLITKTRYALYSVCLSVRSCNYSMSQGRAKFTFWLRCTVSFWGQSETGQRSRSQPVTCNSRPCYKDSERAGALKMWEWKMRHGQNCNGGKYRSGKSRSR